MNRISVLDSLRGLAASIVVFHHVFYSTSFFWELKNTHYHLFMILDFISDLNQHSVFFFFILSGFCIQLSSSKMNFSLKKDLNTYFFKRFNRILPLYWFSLILTLLIGIAMYQTKDPVFGVKSFVGNLLFLQTSNTFDYSWFVPYGNNGPLWSLAYEMFYYLLFPFYWLLILKIHSKMKFSFSAYDLAFIGSFVFSLLGFVLNKLLPNPFFTYSIYFIMWYSGVYLAYLYQNKLKKYSVMLLFLSIVIVLEVVMIPYLSLTINNICKSSLMMIAAYLFYVFPVLRNNIVFQFLKNLLNQLFTKIGEGSYALYLIHYPILTYLLSIGRITYWYEILFFFVSMPIISFWIEKLIVKIPFTFLKLNYVGK